MASYYVQLLFTYHLADRHISKLSVIASSMSPSIYALSFMYCAYDGVGGTVIKNYHLIY